METLAREKLEEALKSYYGEDNVYPYDNHIVIVFEHEDKKTCLTVGDFYSKDITRTDYTHSE